MGVSFSALLLTGLFAGTEECGLPRLGTAVIIEDHVTFVL